MNAACRWQWSLLRRRPGVAWCTRGHSVRAVACRLRSAGANGACSDQGPTCRRARPCRSRIHQTAHTAHHVQECHRWRRPPPRAFLRARRRCHARLLQAPYSSHSARPVYSPVCAASGPEGLSALQARVDQPSECRALEGLGDAQHVRVAEIVGAIVAAENNHASAPHKRTRMASAWGKERPLGSVGGTGATPSDA